HRRRRRTAARHRPRGTGTPESSAGMSAAVPDPGPGAAMSYPPSGALQLSATVEDGPAGIHGQPLRRIVWRRLRGDRPAMAGGCVLLLIVLIATFASPLIHLYGQQPSAFNSDLISYDTSLPLGRFGGISAQHWLGIEPTS